MKKIRFTRDHGTVNEYTSDELSDATGDYFPKAELILDLTGKLLKAQKETAEAKSRCDSNPYNFFKAFEYSAAMAREQLLVELLQEYTDE